MLPGSKAQVLSRAVEGPEAEQLGLLEAFSSDWGWF